MNTELDKSSGNIIVHQGEIYYSPNCSRSISLPTQDPKIGTEHSIFRFQTSRTDDFTEPFWWTEAHGWLAFVPRKPSYTGVLFKRLAKVPSLMMSLKDEQDHFVLPPEIKDSWDRLDWWLNCATSTLAKHFNVSVVRPFSPWSMGHVGGHYSYGYTLSRIYRARDWFSIWMGLLSYLIAKAKSANANGTDVHWQIALCHNGFPIDTVDALQASTVCDFSRITERAGVFLDITSKNTKQPAIEWFLKYNIPVWYRWGSKEVAISSLAYLAPTASQMQRAVLALTNPVQETRTLSKQRHPSTQTTKRPEYEAFFAARDERNARLLLCETAAARQTRLNRERRPPTVSAKVFEWSLDEEDENVWCRVQVRKADREETLGQYSEAQRRYDSFSNEWDCCEEFGPSDHDYEAEFEEFYAFPEESTDSCDLLEPPYDNTKVPRVLSPSHQPAHLLESERLNVPRVHPLQHAVVLSEPVVPESPASPELSSEPIPIPLSDSRSIDMLQQEILEILVLHYGFTPPLPLPSSLPLLTSAAEARQLVRWLGLGWVECQPHIMAVPCAALARSYLEGIIAGRHPKDDECDFNVRSRISLSMSERCKYLRIVTNVDDQSQSLYMFDFGDKSEMPWKLTLTTAADALMVCRLDSRLRESDVAEYLLQNGIPFRTCLPLELASRAPRQLLPPSVLPTRLSDSSFGLEDYNSYLRQRESLLNQPRARAALMRGGFIWRLSASVVSFSTVFQGPTGLSSVPNTMLRVRDPKTNRRFIDDTLTELEFNLISGMYICHTGFGHQTVLRSWFPTMTTSEASGEEYGRWNGNREYTFTKRLNEITNTTSQTNSRGPISSKKWRDLLRGNKEIRRIRDTMESWSQSFIQQHLSNS